MTGGRTNDGSTSVGKGDKGNTSKSSADGVSSNLPKEQVSADSSNTVVISGGKSSETHSFVSKEDGSFGFDLGKTRGRGGIHHEDVPGNTAEAIPVLFTDGGSRDLDGIYSVNYSVDKLEIKPASKKVDIPDPSEIRNSSEQGLSFTYQSMDASYEVIFGNGIVTLYPQDDTALDIITQENRKAERAVLASGILTAIEDLGVTPVEIRAVYIFKVLNGKSALASA